MSLMKAVRAPLLAGAVLMVLFAPRDAAAQTGVVYVASDLTALPKMASMDRAARAIQSAYPENLRSSGVGGTVQLQLIVGPDGKVEPQSIEVMSATVAELGAAAKEAASKLEFTPGRVKDEAVRAKVVLPITFRAS